MTPSLLNRLGLDLSPVIESAKGKVGQSVIKSKRRPVKRDTPEERIRKAQIPLGLPTPPFYISTTVEQPTIKIPLEWKPPWIDPDIWKKATDKERYNLYMSETSKRERNFAVFTNADARYPAKHKTAERALWDSSVKTSDTTGYTRYMDEALRLGYLGLYGPDVPSESCGIPAKHPIPGTRRPPIDYFDKYPQSFHGRFEWYWERQEGTPYARARFTWDFRYNCGPHAPPPPAQIHVEAFIGPCKDYSQYMGCYNTYIPLQGTAHTDWAPWPYPEHCGFNSFFRVTFENLDQTIIAPDHKWCWMPMEFDPAQPAEAFLNARFGQLAQQIYGRQIYPPHFTVKFHVRRIKLKPVPYTRRPFEGWSIALRTYDHHLKKANLGLCDIQCFFDKRTGAPDLHIQDTVKIPIKHPRAMKIGRYNYSIIGGETYHEWRWAVMYPGNYDLRQHVLVTYKGNAIKFWHEGEGRKQVSIGLPLYDYLGKPYCHFGP